MVENEKREYRNYLVTDPALALKIVKAGFFENLCYVTKNRYEDGKYIYFFEKVDGVKKLIDKANKE